MYQRLCAFGCFRFETPRLRAQVYAVLPAAAAFMVGYNWLSNHVGSRALFHLTITPFFAFYALFAFVMYPMRGVLHHAAGVVDVAVAAVFCVIVVVCGGGSSCGRGVVGSL